MQPTFVSRLLVIATLAIAASPLNAEETSNTLKFSDPAKPGTLRISVMHGDLRITGSDTTEVSVRSDARPQQKRKDGLRVLTEASSYALREKDNVITLDALSEGWGGTPSDFQITVPRNTNVVINSMAGDIHCRAVAGDVEIKTKHGELELEDLAGGVIVETMNGEIEAGFRELQTGKSYSFSSMNGPVLLRLPEDAKANIRFRTQNGSILTDFEDKALVHKVEATSGGGRIRVAKNGVLDEETRKAIREVGRASAEVARRTAEAIREAAEAAREGAAEIADNVEMPHPPKPPMPGLPPIPAIPSITGGKVVTGALNGGGPEISVTTMNGDVTLRRLSK